MGGRVPYYLSRIVGYTSDFFIFSDEFQNAFDNSFQELFVRLTVKYNWFSFKSSNNK